MTTVKMSAPDILQSHPENIEARAISKNAIAVFPVTNSSSTQDPTSLQTRETPSSAVKISDLREPSFLPTASIDNLEKLTITYTSKKDLDSFPLATHTDISKLLKLFHTLVNSTREKQSSLKSGVENLVFIQLSQNPMETYREIVYRFPLTQEYPEIESSFMKVVYRIDIPKTDKVNYLKKIYQRRFDHDHGERSTRLKTNISEAAQYLESMKVLE